MSRQILEMLKGRELTALDIRHALRTSLDVPAVLNFMCDQGLLIRGRLDKGGPDPNYCYALFSEYFPKVRLEPMREREATMHIVRQHLRSFGPAMEADIAFFAGLGDRSMGSAGADQAAEYIFKQFTEAGLSSVGTHKFLHPIAEVATASIRVDDVTLKHAKSHEVCNG